MNSTIIFTFAILSIVSFITTWFLAIYLHLDFLHLFVAFTGLLILNNILVNVIYPLKQLQNALSNLSAFRLFGIVLFGTSTAFINITILWSRFGWKQALVLGFVPALIANALTLQT